MKMKRKRYQRLRHKRSKHKYARQCEQCGTRESLLRCRVDPGGRVEHTYCATHAPEHGFCAGCGIFCAGINSFDFGVSAGWCDNCYDQIRSDMADELDEPDDLVYAGDQL